jgi:hypothetical protein
MVNFKKITKKGIFPLKFLHFLPLDPDSQYGSGSTKSLNPDPIRIHNPVTLVFFHQTISPRAVIHGLNPFRIWLGIRRENRVGGRLFMLEFPFNRYVFLQL